MTNFSIMLAPYLGVPKQCEVLIIIFLGICFLSLDFSLFQVKSNLQEIWKIQLIQSPKVLEWIAKYIISAVLLVRTFTLHVFLSCYVIMLWPAIFEEKANLMLPWLMLGILRCLIVNGVSLIFGTLVCKIEKGLFNPLCLEYIMTQVVEHGPSVYAWMAILSFYRDIAHSSSLHDSSDDSLINKSMLSETSGKTSAEFEKSYSLSDIDLRHHMYSSIMKELPGDNPVEIVISQIRDRISKCRFHNEVTKSFTSLVGDKESEGNLTVKEKIMKTLELSEDDVQEAKKEKNHYIQVLRDISLDNKDIQLLPKSRFLSKTHDMKIHYTCHCYLRKLKPTQSNQTLLENEIASISLGNFDDIVNGNGNKVLENKDKVPDDKNTGCAAVNHMIKRASKNGCLKEITQNDLGVHKVKLCWKNPTIS